jgi:hypothetical protein
MTDTIDVVQQIQSSRCWRSRASTSRVWPSSWWPRRGRRAVRRTITEVHAQWIITLLDGIFTVQLIAPLIILFGGSDDPRSGSPSS